MRYRGRSVVALLLAALLAGSPAAARDAGEAGAIIEHATDPWTGDLDGIIERGFLRVLTVYNPLYFDYLGFEQQGLAVEIARALQAHLRKSLGGKAKHLQVIMVPVAREDLLDKLNRGIGDIAAANLTITPARQKRVAFTDPTYPDVRELIVTGPAAPEAATFDDLAKTEVHVRASSSYFEHLETFNRARRKAGKSKLRVRKADERLEDYDLLDMVDKGLIPAVVVDSHMASLWSRVFANIRVHEDLAIHSGGEIAWALRKNSPALLKAANGFVGTVRKGTLLGNTLLKRYLGKTNWMDSVHAGGSQEKYRDTLEIIQRYAGRYGFDWRMIAAQGYQESRLDHGMRSPAGAVGVMQILPATAADPNVGIRDISSRENNVHAGVKYLRFLRDRYFSDAGIEPMDRVLLSLAAYNAGPRNIARARNKATQMGFDPNRWFGHVEVAAAKSISREPVTYVRNIYKYYVVFSQLEAIRVEREALLED